MRRAIGTETQMHTSAANTHSLLALKREIITREWHKSGQRRRHLARRLLAGAQALYEPAKEAAVNGLSFLLCGCGGESVG